MKLTENTVLITGGSAGIGFEIAKKFSENNNKVIITGRSKDRLDKAVSSLRNVTGIVCDVRSSADLDSLIERINSDFKTLNIVINNAGRALLYDVNDEHANIFEKAQEEMLTNYLSIARINERILSLLKAQPTAAIVNVSSIVAFVPGRLVGYSASKAALHSYTQSLRMAL